MNSIGVDASWRRPVFLDACLRASGARLGLVGYYCHSLDYPRGTPGI